MSRGEAFDVVIANAGVMNYPFGRTVDGFETHFGTNHLGHFVLVNRIAPLIRDGGRVVTLTSLAHHAADVDLDDPGLRASRNTTPSRPTGGRRPPTSCSRSSSTDAFAAEASRGIAVQPGGIRTALLRHTTPEVMQEMLQQVHSQLRSDGHTDDPPPVKTVEQGAATTVVGRLRRRCRGGGRPLLRGLPRRRGEPTQATTVSGPTPSTRDRRGALWADERGPRRGAVLMRSAPRIAIYGVGQYGSLIARLAIAKGWPVVAAFNRAGPKVGQDLGRVAGLGRDLGVIIQDSRVR